MSTGTLSRIFSVFLMVFGAAFAQAADITWGGIYRAEAVKIVGPEMSTPTSDKAYLLHHMVLMPKIVAGDGLTIFGRLDVLNDPNFGINGAGQVMSVAGDLLGGGPNTQAPSATNPARGTDSNAYGQTERASPLQVTSLYATWNMEFGQLVVGRVPMQFGLGTYYSAGNGLFDHYISSQDLVGYKVVLGNLYFLPMLGKMSEGALGQEDDVDNYMMQVQYENPESELSLGILYQIRVVTGNDAPLSGTIGGTGATRTGSFKNNLIALFFSEKVGSSFRAGVEADMLSGDTGVQTAGLAGVGLNAFGIAGEFSWLPTESKLSGVFKLGLASGDDPGTQDVYEGYQFNRNYDVALLLFNHPLGQKRFLAQRFGSQHHCARL